MYDESQDLICNSPAINPTSQHSNKLSTLLSLSSNSTLCSLSTLSSPSIHTFHSYTSQSKSQSPNNQSHFQNSNELQSHTFSEFGNYQYNVHDNHDDELFNSGFKNQDDDVRGRRSFEEKYSLFDMSNEGDINYQWKSMTLDYDDIIQGQRSKILEGRAWGLSNTLENSRQDHESTQTPSQKRQSRKSRHPPYQPDEPKKKSNAKNLQSLFKGLLSSSQKILTLHHLSKLSEKNNKIKLLPKDHPIQKFISKQSPNRQDLLSLILNTDLRAFNAQFFRDGKWRRYFLICKRQMDIDNKFMCFKRFRQIKKRFYLANVEPMTQGYMNNNKIGSSN